MIFRVSLVIFGGYRVFFSCIQLLLVESIIVVYCRLRTNGVVICGGLFRVCVWMFLFSARRWHLDVCAV